MKTYLINLDRQLERLSSATLELAMVDLSHVRVSAVDMFDLVLNEEDLVTSGVRACWLSHLKVLQLIAEGKEPRALVLEDDIEILDKKGILKVLSSPDLNSWDLIQIGFITPGVLNKLTRRFRNIEHDFFKVIHFVSLHSPLAQKILGNRLRVRLAGRVPSGFVGDDFLPGTHAYLISQQMAKSVLSLNSPQFLSADDFYSALSHMRSFKCIRLKKSYIGQKDFPKFGGDRFKNQGIA